MMTSRIPAEMTMTSCRRCNENSRRGALAFNMLRSVEQLNIDMAFDFDMFKSVYIGKNYKSVSCKQF